VYINFLITAGLGFAIGIAVWQIVIKLGKVRNYGLAILLALIASLAAYYFQWVVWTNLVLTSSGEESQLLYLLSNPFDLFQLIGFINEILADRNGESGYQIACDPEVFTVKYFINRFEGKNEERYEDIFDNLQEEDRELLEKIRKNLTGEKIWK